MRPSPRISLRCIRSFIAIVDQGSFRKAAEVLMVSQPALSARLRDLEAQLGITLLRRTTHYMQVTDRGKIFLGRARRAVNDLDTAILDIQDQAAEERGHVTVACVPSIAAGLFPLVIRAFAKDHPKTAVEVCDVRTEIMEDRVLRGQADFGVGPGGGGSADLIFERVIDDRYLALCARTHPLAKLRSVTLKELSQFPMISMRPEQSMRRLLEKTARERGVLLHTVHQVYNHDTLLGMVGEGLGIGAMPLLTVTLQQRSDIVCIPISDPVVSREIGIISRRGESLSGVVQELAQTTKEMLANFALGSIAKFESARMRGKSLDRRE